MLQEILDSIKALIPSCKIKHFYISTTSAVLTGTLAPAEPFRLISMDVHTSAVLDMGEVLTVTKDAGKGEWHDTVIFSQDLFIGSITSLHVVFGEGYEFDADDRLDIAQANGSADDIGIDITYELL
jgi:hypothetical protein